MNARTVDLHDGSSFDIPPGTDEDDRYIAQYYATVINAVEADPQEFLSTSACAVSIVSSNDTSDEC